MSTDIEEDMLETDEELAPEPPTVAAGIARGVCRMLRAHGYGALTEFRIGKGRRVDIMAIDRQSRFLVVEVKSSVEDFRADRKWHEYLDYCDSFYFAVGPDFPRDLLPDECGIIVADAFAAEILRPSPELGLHTSRRRAQVVRFALVASGRLQETSDPLIG